MKQIKGKVIEVERVARAVFLSSLHDPQLTTITVLDQLQVHHLLRTWICPALLLIAPYISDGKDLSIYVGKSSSSAMTPYHLQTQLTTFGRIRSNVALMAENVRPQEIKSY